MHNRIVVASLVIALLTPTAAHAGFVLGARAAWAIPGGELRNGTDLGDLIDGQVPLWVDLGWSIADQLTLGVYARFAANVVDSDAIEDCSFLETDCGGYGLGLGAQLAYRFGQRNAGPWLGAFGGLEALSFEQIGDLGTADQAYRGWELGAQGGIDFAWHSLVFGPFATWSVGRYTVLDDDLADVSSGAVDLGDAANHWWVQLGLRVAFDL